MMKRLFVLLLFVLVANAASAQYTAVRVNTLGLATGTVNAGVDVAVSEKWSVEASAYWNPISTESLRTKVLGAVVGVRRCALGRRTVSRREPEQTLQRLDCRHRCQRGLFVDAA